MNRNIKYKQVSRIMLFGDDDINTTTNSQYIMYPSSINGITVNYGGTNYNVSYTQIKIVGGGGSGAVATPTVSGGAINSITMSIHVLFILAPQMLLLHLVLSIHRIYQVVQGMWRLIHKLQ